VEFVVAGAGGLGGGVGDGFQEHGRAARAGGGHGDDLQGDLRAGRGRAELGEVQVGDVEAAVGNAVERAEQDKAAAGADGFVGEGGFGAVDLDGAEIGAGDEHEGKGAEAVAVGGRVGLGDQGGADGRDECDGCWQGAEGYRTSERG